MATKAEKFKASTERRASIEHSGGSGRARRSGASGAGGSEDGVQAGGAAPKGGKGGRGTKPVTGTTGATVDKGTKGTGDARAAKGPTAKRAAGNGAAAKGAARKGAMPNAEQSEQGIAQSGKRTSPGRKRPQDKPVDTSAPGVSVTNKKGGGSETGDRNRSAHAAKKASYALESSEEGTPSRKSTRRSANRIKPDSQLKRRQTRATTSPKAQATKAKANAVKAG
jgi:hypothetical protein